MDTALASTSNTAERVAAILARTHALGWSQNRLARRVRRDSGHMSKVFTLKAQSNRLLNVCEATLAREEQRRAS